ncbi:MAG: glyoxylate/hydroxypyruvate reductase A [Alphaproteobacteria bacterium]|nr:MAG: glyoxylate/hydroxypyruvate reductase A [Alphaproteobacteria bacterium]
MPRILLNLPPDRIDPWRTALARALAGAGIAAELVTAPQGAIDYVVHAPDGPLQDFAALPGLRAVLNTWAGVEGVVNNPTLKVPLARMVDPGLTEGMVEYVTGHVLRHHLGMDRHIVNPAREWRHEPPPLARERGVGILGLGVLGTACARALAALNFRVTGWSRRPRDLAGIDCRAGAEGLAATLARAEILVLLLPLTPATGNLIDARRLGLLPRGACIINAGRGQLIDDAALLEALDSGQVGHATLDVFRIEPLPPDHPFWSHPRVTVTPHVAAETRPASAAPVIAENIRRDLAGLPLRHLVDREAGY